MSKFLSRTILRLAILISLITITMYLLPEYQSAILLSALALFSISFWIFNYEHPKSTARIFAEDARSIDMPENGGEGKSVIVVGGGISGLSAAKYLIRAGLM